MKEPTEFNAIKHVVKACKDCPFLQPVSICEGPSTCAIDKDIRLFGVKNVHHKCPLRENDQVITYRGTDSKRCGYVWVLGAPGFLDEHGNPQPTTKLRCSLLQGHEGECQYVRLP